MQPSFTLFKQKGSTISQEPANASPTASYLQDTADDRAVQ